MGGHQPKPDYIAGLKRNAFTETELEKPRNYATPSKPFFVTPQLSFPFLICEVENGKRGLAEAERQNMHSASIAVRAIIELHKAAFGDGHDVVKALYGQILVFTVAHDYEIVKLCGHFAVSADDLAGKLRFHRHSLAMFSLIQEDDRDKFKPYNFIRNVYDKIAPAHLQRIQLATAKLPEFRQRTGTSFAKSELVVRYSDSQESSDVVSLSDDA